MNICYNCMHSCHQSSSLLQSSVSHDPSEIILICWLLIKKHSWLFFLWNLIQVKNSITKIYKYILEHYKNLHYYFINSMCPCWIKIFNFFKIKIVLTSTFWAVCWISLGKQSQTSDFTKMSSNTVLSSLNKHKTTCLPINTRLYEKLSLYMQTWQHRKKWTLSKNRNLPTAPCVCSWCVFLDGLNTEHKFPSMGYHTWPHITSLKGVIWCDFKFSFLFGVLQIDCA